MSNGEFYIQPLAGTVKSSTPSNVTLPQDVASFRVSLSDKEKEDSNKLVLPYMRFVLVVTFHLLSVNTNFANTVFGFSPI